MMQSSLLSSSTLMMEEVSSSEILLFTIHLQNIRYNNAEDNNVHSHDPFISHPVRCCKLEIEWVGVKMGNTIWLVEHFDERTPFSRVFC
jgi:hypothetical protein